MTDYTAYGLRVRSELPLPELKDPDGGRAEPDVTVRLGAVGSPPGASNGWRYRGWSTPEGDLAYAIRHVGAVRVCGGDTLIADVEEGPGQDGFHHLVSGIGLGLALHQRGSLTLHASAVAIDGGVAAFVGWKTMGKSTTAATLYGRGHALVTDDVLALDVVPGGVQVQPGYPAMKLFPDSAHAALGDDADALPRIHPDGSKRARGATERFSTRPLPLRAVYVLDFGEDGEPLSAERLAPADACVELVRHSFALRLLGAEAASGAHLEQLAHLVRHVPVRRLRRPRELGGLDRIAERVEADVSAHALAA